MKETIDAKNSLEGYAYSMKNTVNDEDKLGDKIDEDDKETIEEAVSEVIDWLDENPEAEKEEYEEKLKEFAILLCKSCTRNMVSLELVEKMMMKKMTLVMMMMIMTFLTIMMNSNYNMKVYRKIILKTINNSRAGTI